MPIPLLIAVAGAVIASAAVALWPRILDWVRTQVIPMVATHVPSLAPLIENAFAALDKVVSPLRSKIRQSWEALKPHLLKAVVAFERRVDNTYVRQVTTYLREALASTGAVKTVTQEVIAFEDLPADVRDQMFRKGEAATVDVKQQREMELAEVAA